MVSVMLCLLMILSILYCYNHQQKKGDPICPQPPTMKMQSFPKYKHRNNESLLTDQNVTNHLSSFIRSSHSPSYLELQSTHVLPKSSKKMVHVQEQQSFQMEQIKKHYETIEKVLNEQNLNLKMQSKYLAAEMRKSLKREKIQKEDMERLNELYEKTKNRLNLLLKENAEIKEYVESKIILLVNSLKLNSHADLVDEINQIIQELCQYFSINLQIQQRPINIVVKSNRIQQQIEVDSRIEQLNDKFESLMFQYKSTTRPEIRKKCIDIAKQIKTLKMERKESINQDNIDQKTVQQLSRNQSNDYLSMKSKHSKQSHQFDESKYYNFQSTEKQSFSKHLGDNLPLSRNRTQGKPRPSSFRQDTCER